MYYRRKILLSLLELFDNKLDKLRLQKLLMLLSEDQAKPSFYFVPYKFGCYSFQANADLNTMVKYGQIKDDEKTWLKVDSEKYLPQLKDTDRKTIQLIKERFGNTTISELIHYTYKNFPFYALNSTIATDILDNEELKTVVNERPKNKSSVLYTIGYEGKTLEQYLNTLIRFNIEVLCDVRKNPFSMKYGFSKSQLQYACSGLGIRYVHMPELGIESDKRQQLNNQADYDRLFLQYQQIVLTNTRTQQNEILELLKSYKRVALTCFEANICQCHRTHLAKELSVSPGFEFDLQHI